MKIKVYLKTPHTPTYWSRAHYVRSVDLTGPRPVIIESMYPHECSATVPDVIAALDWMLDLAPHVTAYQIVSGDFSHVVEA